MMQALMILMTVSYLIMSGLVSRLTQHLKSSDRKHPNDALSLLSLRIFFYSKLKVSLSSCSVRSLSEWWATRWGRAGPRASPPSSPTSWTSRTEVSFFVSIYQSPRTFFTRKAANNFQGEEFLRFLCDVYADRQALERGWRRSGPGFIFQTNQKLFKDYQYSPKILSGKTLRRVEVDHAKTHLSQHPSFNFLPSIENVQQKDILAELFPSFDGPSWVFTSV